MQLGIVEQIAPKDPNEGLQFRKTAPNVEFRRLLEGDAPDGFNFWCTHVVHRDTGEDGFQTPRHNHTFQQIRYVIKGEVNIGPDDFLNEGELIYVPRGAYYGPQKRETTCASIGMQFGFNGEHQRGPYWENARAETFARLKAKGRIEAGLYYQTDPVTGKVSVRDAADAAYDERHRLLKGTPLTIPAPRYRSPEIMYPDRFTYWDAAPGVELKHLGKFYDQPGPNGDITISMARLSGGVHALRADRPQVVWAFAAGLEVAGRTCPSFTTLYSPLGEEITISGNDGLEVFIFEFPRLG